MAQYPQTKLFDPATSSATRTRRNVWLRLTSYQGQDEPNSIERRELIRRSQLMSWISLGLLVALLLLLPLGLSDLPTLETVIGLVAIVVFSLVLNRRGLTTVAGVLIVCAIDVGALSVVVRQDGGLSLDSLPVYDLLVTTVVIGATVLPRSSAFFIAVLNSLLVVGDYILQPHGPDVVANAAYYGHSQTVMAISLLARPVALEVLVSVVAYLWVRSTDSAIRRADRAEEIASLEHSLAEQKRQLDIGIQQILQTHVRVANGDFSARTPLGQDNVLWQIAVSLNNLLARLQRTNQTEYLYQRTQEEIARIVAAIDDMQAGRRPIWPAPTGTPVDALLERLVQAAYISGPPARAPHSQPNSQPLPYGQPGPTSQPVPYRADPGALGGLPPMGAPNRAPYSAPPSFAAPNSMPTTRAQHPGAPFPPAEHSDRSGLPSMPANPWAFPLDEE